MFSDEVAARYDDWYLSVMGDFAERVQTDLALELLPVHPGDRILDAGCGTGNFSIVLAELGAAVTGIDIAPAMLAVAREKARQRDVSVDFAEMDMVRLAYKAGHFDSAVSMAVFEFVTERQTAFDELMRVIKPGGRLLIGTINAGSPWADHYRTRAEGGDSVFRHANFLTMGELMALDPDNLIATGGCLFIPPDAPVEKITRAGEKEARADHPAGFIAGLWRKPRMDDARC